MAFHDVRFPDAIAAGAEGGPGYSTSIAEGAGGHEQRNQNWAQARGAWNVGTGLKDATGIAELIAFFRLRRGRLHGFRFRDWSDYRMPRQAIGTTGGGDATWQLLRTYSDGAYSVDRPLTKPVAGSVRCWVNGTERGLGTGTSQFQIDLLTGIITLGSALAGTTGQAIEASCDFDVPVRFDIDRLPLRLDAFEIGAIPDIPILEVRA